MLTEEQRINRSKGLGASDSAIIMGYSSYKTPYELYLEKTGQVEIMPEHMDEQQYWGNEIEPLIIKRFAKENNVEVTFPDTIYHPNHRFIFANLDGWIESENAVVEAKCANSFQRKEWDFATSDGIPIVYLIQIAKQVAVTNADRGYCAVLIGGNEYRQFVYERDLALEELIIESDINFWDCVVKRREPDLVNTSDCRLKYKNSTPDLTCLSTFKTSNALAELCSVKLEGKRLDKLEDEFKMHIMQYMGNAEYLVGQEGEILATWKPTKKGTRVFNIK